MHLVLRPLAVLALGVGVLTGCDAVSSTTALDAPGTPAFAHESNSRAELTGTGDATLTGQAIVNYAKGAPNEWRSTVNLQGDLDAGTYDFYVTLNGTNATLVCSFTVGEMGGRQGCSADTDLPGFNRAEIRTSEGEVVASGAFTRRGGNRL